MYRVFPLLILLFTQCGAKEKREVILKESQRTKPPVLGARFAKIPPSKGYKKPIPPFPELDGSTLVPSFKPGEKVWSPIPVGGAWEIVNYSIARVVRVEASRVHLRALRTDFVVPGAMLMQVKHPKRVRPRQAVLCALGMASEWARVIKVHKKRVLVGMVWGANYETREVKTNFIQVMEPGKALPGSPVILYRGRRWEQGLLIHRTKQRSWIIGYAGKLITLPNHRVRLVPTGEFFKERQQVWTPWYEALEEARVLKVLGGGAAYLVRFSSRPTEEYRNPRVVSFARVVKPQG